MKSVYKMTDAELLEELFRGMTEEEIATYIKESLRKAVR